MQQNIRTGNLCHGTYTVLRYYEQLRYKYLLQNQRTDAEICFENANSVRSQKNSMEWLVGNVQYIFDNQFDREIEQDGIEVMFVMFPYNVLLIQLLHYNAARAVFWILYEVDWPGQVEIILSNGRESEIHLSCLASIYHRVDPSQLRVQIIYYR